MTGGIFDSLRTILQQVDYLPYGEKCRNNALVSGNNDYFYGGKGYFRYDPRRR